jgi:hypothetical protein
MTGIHNVIAGGKTLPASSSNYLSAVSFSGDSNVYNISSRSLGTADPRRKILVAITNSRFLGAAAPSSVQLDTGPIAMTKIGESDNTSINTTFWIASVPTGTADTFTVTYASSRFGMAFAIWNLIMYSSTPHQVISDAGTSPANSGSITCPANSLAVAAYGVYATVTTTWTNLTEDADGQYDSGSAAFAREAFATAQTGLSVVATASSAGQEDALCVVVLTRGE